MSTLHIRLLGDFLLVADDTPVSAFNVPRLLALLAYLLLKRDAPQPRQQIAFLLWPDSTETQARANLRRLLHLLHQALPNASHFVRTDTQTVQWRSDAPFTLDVAEFESAFLRADQAERAKNLADERQALLEAVEAYHGELLPSCYDEWILPERERLHQAFLAALERLIALLERTRDFAAAIDYARQLVRHEPLREECYRNLMRLQARKGDRAAALETYRSCVAVLERELGIEPSTATQEVYQQLHRLETSAGPRHNLPAQTTSFIGREAEQMALIELLERPACRLVTLTGTAGIGKTRLALQVAGALRDDYPDGIWFVALAPIRDANLVVSAIAQTLDVKEGPDQPLLDQLKRELRAKQMLLVLDNFEQVIAAAPQVGELLAGIPGLKIVVTSREVLRLYGEQEYELSPLSLPGTRRVPPLEQLTRYEAVCVFVERAQAVKPDFAVSDENAVFVAAICTRLDGLPLALELAAARSKLFTPQALLARLDKRLNLLTNGAHDLPPRHQTLRGAIDWSHHLLKPEEQLVFRRLAVFVGGCTLEAAQAVVGFDVSAFGRSNLLDWIVSLIDHSLLRQETGSDGEPRLMMLETIREYAFERLEASGERESLLQRHATLFLDLTAALESKLHSAEHTMWLDRVEREHDNLRAALAWTLGGGNIELGIQLAGALWSFWWIRGYGSEGRRWLEQALHHSGSAAPVIRANILLVCGYASVHDDYERATALGTEALELFRELRDTSGVMMALHHMADMAWRHGDYARATALSAESLELFRAQGDRRGVALALHKLGDIARDQGEYARADTLLEESLAVWRSLGQREACAFVLNGLGDVALNQGDYALAASRYQQALELFQELDSLDGAAWIRRNLGRLAHLQGDDTRAAEVLGASVARFREVGDEMGLAWALHHLGMATHAQGDDTQAAALLREALLLQQKQGHKSRLVESLEGCAELAAAHGQAVRAARLLGACEALRAAIAAPLAPGERMIYKRTVASIQVQLDDATFAATWAEGRAMTLDQAIAYALEFNPSALPAQELGVGG